MENLIRLLVCTGNSCRSQMAEGWARHLLEIRVEVYSAGTKPHGVNFRAVKVMAEEALNYEEALDHYRRARDEIREFVNTRLE